MCRRYLGYNKTSSFYYPDARFNSHYRQIRSNRSGSFFKTSTSSYYVPVNDIHEKYIYTISHRWGLQGCSLSAACTWCLEPVVKFIQCYGLVNQPRYESSIFFILKFCFTYTIRLNKWFKEWWDQNLDFPQKTTYTTAVFLHKSMIQVIFISVLATCIYVILNPF